MKILNLVTKEDSEIEYTILKFPDGQRDIILDLSHIPLDNNIHIYSRFNNFEDLGLIICTTKALNNLGYNKIHLYIPYLLGARSDRMFIVGGNSYLRDIIAPILNSLNFLSIACLDVHSPIAEAVIKNLIVEDNSNLVKWALEDINSKNTILVAPDAGAQHKIFSLARKIGYKGEIISCNKERDLATGKILDIKVNDGYTSYKQGINSDFIIIDDIADGCKTFTEIAKVIKAKHPDNKLYLIVTHGIFSQGFKELKDNFTRVYCSNSYNNIVNYGIHGDIVKQLKVI